MSIVQVPAILDSIRSRKDKTLSLNLGLPELTPEDTASLFTMANSQIWLALSPVSMEYSDIDIPDKIPEFTGQKSFAQRLRAVIHVYWENNKELHISFKTSNAFYEYWMENKINEIKEKLA